MHDYQITQNNGATPPSGACVVLVPDAFDDNTYRKQGGFLTEIPRIRFIFTQVYSKNIAVQFLT